jgi:VIT1/CCC1 family predicted Fe2+/Mn2+ transporter
LHSSAGFYVKALVFGGLDGILEMFAVINGIVGSGHCSAYIIVLGFASLLADGLTMALGDFLSERAGKKIIFYLF